MARLHSTAVTEEAVAAISSMPISMASAIGPFLPERLRLVARDRLLSLAAKSYPGLSRTAAARRMAFDLEAPTLPPQPELRATLDRIKRLSDGRALGYMTILRATREDGTD